MGALTATSQKANSAAGLEAACSGLVWPVERERTWFSNRDLPSRKSGQRLSRIDRAVELNLKPSAEVHYFMTPPHPLQPGAYGGRVVLRGVPHAGIYQIALSKVVDLAVFENGVRLKALGIQEAPDCPSVRLSARFLFGPGDLILIEISNAAEPSIKAAFAEVE